MTKLSENFTEVKHKGNKSKKFKVGIGAVIACFALYAVAGLTTFLPIDLKVKGMIIGGTIIVAESSMLLAIILLGKEAVNKYKSKLNPKNWFKKKGSEKANGKDEYNE
ncbi:transporter suffix domain-containing protein [Staphylococcus debuckii]|nr:transporter suffix domain-containing protein [Staphylococcus debuckii]